MGLAAAATLAHGGSGGPADPDQARCGISCAARPRSSATLPSLLNGALHPRLAHNLNITVPGISGNGLAARTEIQTGLQQGSGLQPGEPLPCPACDRAQSQRSGRLAATEPRPRHHRNRHRACRRGAHGGDSGQARMDRLKAQIDKRGKTLSKPLRSAQDRVFPEDRALQLQQRDFYVLNAVKDGGIRLQTGTLAFRAARAPVRGAGDAVPAAARVPPQPREQIRSLCRGDQP